MSKTVIFQTIQFSRITQFSSIGPTDRTLSGGPESDGNKGVLCISKSSSITGASPSNGLVSYLGHSLGESYSSAETQLVYSTVPADWAKHYWSLTINCLVSYPGHSLQGLYPSAEVQSVYSTAPSSWAIRQS